MLGSFERRKPAMVCRCQIASLYKLNVSLIHEIRNMDTYSAKRPICHTEVLIRDFHTLITSKHIMQIEERWDGNGAVVGSKIRAKHRRQCECYANSFLDNDRRDDGGL